MDLTTVKNYLRIDTDEDDDYLKLLTETAAEYIESIIGIGNDERARVKLIKLNIIASLYENRQFTIDKSNEKVQYALQSMLLQLQLECE